MDRYAKLKEMTAALPIINGVKYVEYACEGGTAKSRGLYKDRDVAVARTLIPEGVTFPKHLHGEREWCIVISGELETDVGGEKGVIKDGEYFVAEPGVPHGVLAIKDTWIIAVTVPAAEGFPDAD